MLNIEAQVNIHNKFVVQLFDKRTGELRDTAYAYNIVLNSLYNKLLDLSLGYFTSIAIGTGTGTLSETRTTLFNYLAYRAAVDDTLVLPDDNSLSKTAYRTRKITFNPSELVGSVITEVGIGNSSTIYTHAMLQDSEGNPVTITKTADSVLIINATVYATLEPFADEATSWFYTNDRTNQCFGGGNYLHNLFLDIATSSLNTFYVSPGLIGAKDSAFGYTLLSPTYKFLQVPSNDLKSVADKPNKRFNVAMRAEIDQCNSDIRELRAYGYLYYSSDAYYMLPLFRTTIPCDNFPNFTFSNKIIGTGNGIKKEFEIDKEFPQNVRNIKIAGVVSSDYTLEDTYTGFSWGNVLGYHKPIRTTDNTGLALTVSQQLNYTILSITDDNKFVLVRIQSSYVYKLAIYEIDALTGNIEYVCLVPVTTSSTTEAKFINNGKFIVTPAGVYPFDTVNKIIGSVIGFPSSVTDASIAVSRDEKYIAIYYTTSTKLMQIDRETGITSNLQNISTGSYITNLIITDSIPDGSRWLLYRINTGVIQKMQINATGVISSASTIKTSITNITFAYNGLIAYISPTITPTTVYTDLFDLQTGILNTEISSLPLSVSAGVNTLFLTPDGDYLFTIGNTADTIMNVVKINSTTAVIERLMPLKNATMLSRASTSSVSFLWPTAFAFNKSALGGFSCAGGVLHQGTNNSGYTVNPKFFIFKMTPNTKKIIFSVAPAAEAQVSGDFDVDYIPKNANYILDIAFRIQLGEGL